jgi:outer membrane protein assembly factor BamB
MYMHDVGRSGYNKAETIINRTSAPNLKVHWTYPGGGMIFSQPVVANGLIYWGSFDGYEHATNLSGQQIWQQNLGTRTTCAPVSPLGVVSTAALSTVTINGTPTSVVFVGGGDDHLYALDAASGNIIWSTALGDPSTNTFIWDSPFVFNNNVYIGTGTTGEAAGCSLVAGQLFELDATTGSIVHTFNTVPSGCVGGGIWSSPTFDGSDGSIYFTAGTQGTCSKDTISIGIVKLRASDLTFLSSWQIPVAQRQTNDADFAGTPTLFSATINGTLRKLVGAVDKNGLYYAFDRTVLSNGPVWTAQIAVAGACPQCGKGSISSSVFDGSRLYVAGGNTTIKGISCGGSLQALNPADGTTAWQDCLPKTVLGAITEFAGVVAVVDGSNLTLVNSSTGAQLFNDNGDKYYGTPSVSNGVLYVGSKNSNLYAFGP